MNGRSCAWLTLSLLTIACSEAKTSEGGGGAGEGGAPQGGQGSGASSSDGGSSSSQTTQGQVVINEISATEDWIELYNTGAAAFDLSGWMLADSETPGTPKLDEAIIFPAGTSIAAGASLFILAKQDMVVMPGEQTPQTMCAPGSSPCFFAPFGLSDTDGDEIFLIEGDVTVSASPYPAAAAAEGESWCRLPDGTGNFSVCTPTPGAPNAE